MTKHYLTKPISHDNYNIRLLVKAPADKVKDKKALAVITDTEDHEEVSIRPKVLSYRLFGTSKNLIRSYVNESIISNRFELLTNDLLDELMEDLEARIEDNILLDTTLEEFDDGLKHILEEYLLILNPISLTTVKPVEKVNTDVVEDFLTYEYKQQLLDIQEKKITIDLFTRSVRATSLSPFHLKTRHVTLMWKRVLSQAIDKVHNVVDNPVNNPDYQCGNDGSNHYHYRAVDQLTPGWPRNLMNELVIRLL